MPQLRQFCTVLHMFSRAATELSRPRLNWVLRPLQRCTTYRPPTPAGVRAFSAMDTTGFTDTQLMVRDAISKICSKFPDEYWTKRDETGEYPHDLHAQMAKDGWIGICLPAELGGAGLGILEATTMLGTIAESGAGIAGAQTVHANIYATQVLIATAQPVSKYATEEQKKTWLPPLITGQARTCFGVTEPNTGLETLKLRTRAVRKGDSYLVSGEKIWITNAQIANRMVLLARTTPLEEVEKPSQGLSLFFIDFDKTKPGLDLHRIKKMGGRAVDANEVFFDNYAIGADTLIGTEGDGFKIVLHGMNAERCFLAGEALGLGYAALRRATAYAKERVVFGKPIGQHQSIQHGLAVAYIDLEAAKLATYHAAKLYDEVSAGASDAPPTAVGAACNMAKYLAAEAGYKACERAVLVHGGMGYAQDYHVERYLRECWVPRIAPVSREMILNYVGEKVLKLPKSY